MDRSGSHDGDDDLRRVRSRLSGMRARRRLKDVPEVKRHELVERGLDLGLEAAPSINDRNISLFSRGLDPQFAGINTFLKSPFVEDIRQIGNYDVRHGHDLPQRCALRAAGGPPDLGAV